VIFCTVSRPVRGAAHRDGHVGLALRQVEDARQGDDLDLERRVRRRDGRADLRQHVVGAAVRRADPHLPRQPPGLAPQLLPRRRHRLLGPLGMGEKPLPLPRQPVALRALGEERRAQPLLEPRDPPPDRRRVEPSARPAPDRLSARATARKTRRSSQSMSIPAFLQNAFARLPLSPGNAQGYCGRRPEEDPMQELTHFIDGKRVAGTSGRFADVFNPATGEVQAKVPLASGRARRRRRLRRRGPAEMGPRPTRSAAPA
jgi:hypothetical protein